MTFDSPDTWRRYIPLAITFTTIVVLPTFAIWMMQPGNELKWPNILTSDAPPDSGDAQIKKPTHAGQPAVDVEPGPYDNVSEEDLKKKLEVREAEIKWTKQEIKDDQDIGLTPSPELEKELKKYENDRDRILDTLNRKHPGWEGRMPKHPDAH